MQADGKILVGGGLQNIGGQARNYIARLDPTTGLAHSFDPHSNNLVLSIVVQADGKILAGGAFGGANSIGGQTRNHIVRLDPDTGLADSFDPNASSLVNSIALQADVKILVGGTFIGANSIGGGDVLYTAVDEKPKRTRALQRLRNIEANPRVEVLIDHWDEDWSRLWWVRLRGTARIVEDRHAVELLTAKYPQYAEHPPAGPVIAVEIEERSEWTSSPS